MKTHTTDTCLSVEEMTVDTRERSCSLKLKNSTGRVGNRNRVITEYSYDVCLFWVFSVKPLQFIEMLFLYGKILFSCSQWELLYI